MNRATRLAATIVAVVLVVDLGVVARRAPRPPPAPPVADATHGVLADSDEPTDAGPAIRAANRFLARYVAPDGRVVRHDQGGDTVSEGQAYAMLLAVVADDRATFDLVWSWAREHLQRPDGLLAWHWSGGSVADHEPASDADLDAAWALALAGRRWPRGRGGYDAAAAHLADGIDALETATLPDGRPVLAPGPWAQRRVDHGAELVVNPSYSSPVGEAVLAAAGHVPQTTSAARVAAMRSLVERLLDAGGVPPDWAIVQSDGAVAGVAGPADPGPGRLGWDAVRVPLRLAGSCTPADRDLAARLWAAFESGAGTDRMGDHPARLVAAAAAAAAADQRARAVELLERAAAGDSTAPTYYGGALTALGWALLTTDDLGGCPPLR